jgi:hypothetical protein
MKVKHQFEPSDFEGGGQMIIRNSSPPKSKDLSFAASVAYKICWLSGRDERNYCLISLADGMIISGLTANRLCERLNEDEYGYRPMTKEEIAAIVSEVGNRF